MRRLLLPAVLLLVAGSAFGGPCVPGSLADYYALGGSGCMTNDFLFQSFAAVPGQSFATIIDPTTIQVQPLMGTNGGFFLFTLNTMAGPGELFESIFRFQVSGSTTTASIALGGTSATGDGVVLGVLDVCAGGMFAGDQPSGCSGTPDSAIVFATESDGMTSSSLTFSAPSNFFDVFVDLTVDGGATGTAALGSAQVGVVTPEPSSMALLASGMAVFGLLRKRVKRNSVQ